MKRVVSASVRELLERMEPAIDAGLVNIISVEGIRDRSGDRWQRKREQVEAFVDRAFHRSSPASDLIMALDECEFLTVQGGISPIQAISHSTNILRETLVFFLGAAEPEDLRLLRVARFQDGELSVESITLEDVQREAAAAQEAPQSNDCTPPIRPLEARMRRSARLETGTTNHETNTRAEPVWNVAASAVAAFAMHCETSLVLSGGERRPVTRADMSPGLATHAALHTMDHALDLLTVHPTIRMGLHVPLSLPTLTNSASRYKLLHSMKALDEWIHRYLIIEITDLDEGTPSGRLLEMISGIRPYCRAVLARAPSLAFDPRRWRGTGLSGLTVDCHNLEPGDRGAISRFAQFAARAQEVGPACAAYGLPCRSLIMAAWSAGFTHLSGPIISEHAEIDQGAVRLTPAELYAPVHGLVIDGAAPGATA